LLQWLYAILNAVGQRSQFSVTYCLR